MVIAASAVIIGASNGYIPFTSEVSEDYLTDKEKSQQAYAQLSMGTNLTKGFKDVATAVKPTVVSISTETTFKTQRPTIQRFDFPFESPFFEDDFFRDFNLPQQSLKQEGLGTGFIVRPDGYVVTNNHVIRNATRIVVHLSDKSSYPAEVVGRDVETDLAVLKIDANNLQPITWGESDELEVGEWVVAIGSPFGLDQTVTSGIVSALGRQVGLASYENFIQTDAAINPGNSGGPLVNLKGNLVGINTAIKSRTGVYSGIGFAIPASMARKAIDQIIETGEVSRGFLGVLIQDLNPELASSFNYQADHGVLVSQVTAGTPAEKAGLKPGDILEKLDGQDIESADEIRNQIADMVPGSKMSLQVFRDGKSFVTDVTLEKRNLEKLVSGSAGTGQDRLGLSVVPLNPNRNAQVESGVMVDRVNRDGMAARVGISTGDVILSINGTAIESVADYQDELRKADFKKGVRMRVYSSGATRFVFIRSGN